jgi:anti-sigma factor RsiW
MTEDGVRHRTDALVEYAAGALTGPDRASVEAHLARCPSCRAELASWTTVAAAVVGPVQAPPGPAWAVRAALTRSALTPPAPVAPPARPRRLRFAGQLLRAELRLVRPAVWVASVLVMACAVGLARGGGGDSIGLLLSLVAPLLAVAGVAAVYGPESDPAFEVLAITPTSPRLVLLARVTLVFGYDLVLSLAASALTPLVAPHARLVGLVAAWLGPMALLLALSLALAMWIGPTWSMAVAAGLWGLRVVTVSIPGLGQGWLGTGMRLVWATSPGTVAAAVLLMLAAVWLSRRQGRPGGWPFRPLLR